MSRKKTAPPGSEVSDSSHSSGRLSLKYEDEASYRAFIDRLENDVRSMYGDIACFVHSREYPFRSFPNRELALALCLRGERRRSDGSGVGSSQMDGSYVPGVVTSSTGGSAGSAPTSSVPAGTRANARTNGNGNSLSISSSANHSIDPDQVKEMLSELTKSYTRQVLKDEADKQKIYGLIMSALDQLGKQAVKSDPDFLGSQVEGCPLRLLNIVQRTHVTEIGLSGSKTDAFARVRALQAFVDLKQGRGQSLLSYKESFLLAVQRLETLQCSNVPKGEDLASRFMLGADQDVYESCINHLQNTNQLNPLLTLPDSVEKAYDYMLRHVFPSSQASQRNGTLSFHMGSQSSGGSSKKKKTLTEDELRDLKSKSTCRYCDKVGHWEADCRKKKRDQEENGSLNGSIKSGRSQIKKKSTNKQHKSSRDDVESNEDSDEDNPTSVRAHLDSVLGQDRFRGHFGCNFLMFNEQEDGGVDVSFRKSQRHLPAHGSRVSPKSASFQAVKTQSTGSSHRVIGENSLVTSSSHTTCSSSLVSLRSISSKFNPQPYGGVVTSASAVGGVGKFEKFVLAPAVRGAEVMFEKILVQGVPAAIGDANTLVNEHAGGGVQSSQYDCYESGKLTTFPFDSPCVEYAQVGRPSGDDSVFHDRQTDELCRCLEVGLKCWGSVSRDDAIAGANRIMERYCLHKNFVKPTILLKQILIRCSLLFKEKFGVDGLFPKFKIRKKKGGTSQIAVNNNSSTDVCSDALFRDRFEAKLCVNY